MIINLTKNKILANSPIVALSFLARGRGMIGRNFDDFDAMIFNECNSIHTMFMRIRIDVLFIDRSDKICDLRKQLRPWRPFIRSAEAVSVIELPSGIIERTETVIGDILNLNAEVTKEKEEIINRSMLSTPEAVISMNCIPAINKRIEVNKKPKH